MKVDYTALLKDSWQKLLKNPVLFLPIVIGMLLVMPAFIIIGLEVLVFILIFSNNIFSDPGLVFTSFAGIFLIVLFLLVDLLLVLMMGSYINAMLFGMLKECVEKGRTSVQQMFASGKLLFGRVFWVNTIGMLIYMLPLLLLACITVPLYFVATWAGVGMTIIAVMIFMVYAMIISFFWFFINPIIASEKRSAMGIAKFSFKYSRNNVSHVFMTMLYLFLVSLVLMAVSMIVRIPSMIPGEAGLMLMPLVVIGVIVQMVMQVVGGMLINVFLFNCYQKKKAAKI